MAITDWKETVGVIKDAASILSSLGTVLAALIALYWFYFTRSFKRRVQFGAELEIFDVGADKDYVVELTLTIENKGQREHQIYNLWCEVRQSITVIGSKNVRSYLPITNLVPPRISYFFVLPGVVQKFPKTFLIPREEKMVRVIAAFTYEENRVDLGHLDHLSFEELDRLSFATHSVSRLIEVKPTRNTTRSD